MKYFIDVYNNCQDFDERIKWSRNLKERHKKGLKEVFDQTKIKHFCYRPFSSNVIYNSIIFIDERGYAKHLGEENLTIAMSAKSDTKPFHCLISNKLIDLHFTGDSQCLPLYTYDDEGNKQENITDWGLQQFREYYQPSPPQPPSLSERGGRRLSDNSNSPHPVGEELEVRAITKEDIFYYIYAVLHNPKYREKYELNLKREFPRIPFYDDFNQWKKWGQKLRELHLNYETIKPYPVKIIDLTPPNLPLTLKGGEQKAPLTKGDWGVMKPKLKVDKTKNQILIDDVTTLTEIPPEVWEYKLGNRSAIEWILDQYKDKKAKDSTIAQQFNNYRFSDYKETLIDLLMRVITVSLETMKIIKEMEKNKY